MNTTQMIKELLTRLENGAYHGKDIELFDKLYSLIGIEQQELSRNG